MRLNLRQLAQSNIIFRFETDDDRAEFWHLYVEQNGNMDGNRNRKMLNRHDCWELWIYSEYDKVTFNVVTNNNNIPTWTETKEKYMNDKKIENLAKNIYKAVTNTITDNHNELSQAIALLQSNGYTLTPPYTQPTDEEICERIKAMNEEVGYENNWNDGSTDKYYIYYNYSREEYDYGSRQTCEILGATYTTQPIAQQIVAELNEKGL